MIHSVKQPNANGLMIAFDKKSALPKVSKQCAHVDWDPFLFIAFLQFFVVFLRPTRYLVALLAVLLYTPQDHAFIEIFTDSSLSVRYAGPFTGSAESGNYPGVGNPLLFIPGDGYTIRFSMDDTPPTWGFRYGCSHSS